MIKCMSKKRLTSRVPGDLIVKDQLLLTAVAQVQFLGQEFPHAAHVAKKEKKM